MKRCPRCDQVLPLSVFASSGRRCKPCDAAYSRLRRAGGVKPRALLPRFAHEFGVFMAACAVGGGNANAPNMVSTVSIGNINWPKA